MAKNTRMLRADVEFMDLAKRVAEDNGISMTDATRVIARKLKRGKKPSGGWTIF